MQMPVMKEVLTAMNIPIYECQGWEADDVIGTVGRICGEQDWECVIVTGDRDSLQLIDDHVTVNLETTKGTVRYDRAKFEAEYGFEPKRLIDLKALMGDSSDNIPGVAGVGPKTATDLLVKFGTLDLSGPSSGRSWRRAVIMPICPMNWRPSGRRRPSCSLPGMPLFRHPINRNCTIFLCGWNL